MKKHKLLACLVLMAMFQMVVAPPAEAFLGGLLGGIARGAGGLLGGIARGAGGLFTGIARGAGNLLGGAVRGIGAIGQGLGNVLGGAVRGIANVAGGIGQGIWQGLGWLFGGGPAQAIAQMQADPGANGLQGAQALFRETFENTIMGGNVAAAEEPAGLTPLPQKFFQAPVEEQQKPAFDAPKDLMEEDSPGI